MAKKGRSGMKNVSMLVWLTQLGLSVALPPAVFIGLAVWLQNRFGLGKWVVILGIVVGIVCRRAAVAFLLSFAITYEI